VKSDLIKLQSQAVAEGNVTNGNGTKRLDTPLGQAVFHAQIPTCRHTSNPGNGARVGVYAQDFVFLSLLRAF
jgi:hypothetical protein